MATQKTLETRMQRQAERAARREAQDRQERGQVAAQFITGLARDIYAKQVVLAEQDGALGPYTADELYAHYERQAHKAMDAAIAFVRASNNYDDRGRVAPEAPPIVPEQAPVDANGSPVTLEG